MATTVNIFGQHDTNSCSCPNCYAIRGSQGMQQLSHYNQYMPQQNHQQHGAPIQQYSDSNVTWHHEYKGYATNAIQKGNAALSNTSDANISKGVKIGAAVGMAGLGIKFLADGAMTLAVVAGIVFAIYFFFQKPPGQSRN